MRLLRLFSILFVLTLLSAGSLQGQDEKVLIVGHAETTDSLDPARGYSLTTAIVNEVTYDTLVTFPPDSADHIEPRLAESWTASEDGLTYTFTLRDAKFADDDPITADDVVFSMNRLKNVKGSPSFLTSSIANVEAIDAKTVKFSLNTPSPAFLAYLASPAMLITDAKTIKTHGGTDALDASTTDTAEDYLNSHSAGSGPYILDHWTKQTETVLVRNPNYWGTAPDFDRIIITNLASAAAQKAALEMGDIDIALDLTSDQISALKDNPDISTHSGTGLIVHYLLMNRKPDCGAVLNPKVQAAIRYTLDYEGYRALWGGVTPGTVISVGIPTAYEPDKAIIRDIDHAKQLLKEAGYETGFDVTLDYPAITVQGVNMDTNAQKIQSDLADIGIHVTLNGTEFEVAAQSMQEGKECLGYQLWAPDILDPADTFSFLPGGGVAANANWLDANADKVILDLRDQAKIEINPTKRADLFDRIQAYYQESGPWAPLIQPAVQTAFRSNIRGYYQNLQWLVNLSLLARRTS